MPPPRGGLGRPGVTAHPGGPAGAPAPLLEIGVAACQPSDGAATCLRPGNHQAEPQLVTNLVTTVLIFEPRWRSTCQVRAAPRDTETRAPLGNLGAICRLTEYILICCDLARADPRSGAMGPPAAAASA